MLILNLPPHGKVNPAERRVRMTSPPTRSRSSGLGQSPYAVWSADVPRKRDFLRSAVEARGLVGHDKVSQHAVVVARPHPVHRLVEHSPAVRYP